MTFCAKIGVLSAVCVILSSASSIYYERPSQARLSAAHHPTPGCRYENKRYEHGEQVITPEPCLNCTCKKGVLLCFLRVCPSLFPQQADSRCQTLRPPGECCPTVICDTNATTPFPSSITTTTLTPETESHETKLLHNEVNKSTFRNEHSEPTKSIINRFTEPIREVLEKSDSFVKSDDKILVMQKDQTTIFQTNPTTVFYDSPKLVTSSPIPTLLDESDEIINSIQAYGSCFLNGTLYAEGSAVMSTSFCEYCYCIRGKRMCIRPRCHLSILGCLPRYTSEYACCPTSYVCGTSALSSTISDILISTTTTQATQVSPKVCKVNNQIYRVGEAIPSGESNTNGSTCRQCYCSHAGVKKCKKIQCSIMSGCMPIIPEGHCCPVEYKCNHGQRSRAEAIIANYSAAEVLQETSTEKYKTPIIEKELDLTDATDYTVFSETDPTLILENQTTEASMAKLTDLDEVYTTKLAELDELLYMNDNLILTTPVYENAESITNLPEISTTINDIDLSITPNQETINYDDKKANLEEKLTTEATDKINLVASWRSESINETNKDRVEEFLDGIIHALDHQLHSRLPMEPRNQETQTDPSLPELDDNVNMTKSISPRSEFLIIDKWKGHIKNLNKPQYTKEQINKLGSAATILVVDDAQHGGKQGSGKDAEFVEIITAKTPFMQSSLQNSDSILVNISPNTLRVGTVEETQYKPRRPVMGSVVNVQNEKPKQPQKPQNTFDSSTNKNYKPSSYSPYFAPSNEWKVISQNHSPSYVQSSVTRQKLSGSLYYDNNKTESDLDKRSRLEDAEIAESSLLGPSTSGLNMKFIPFGAGDALGGSNFLKRNGSLLVRLPGHKNQGPGNNKPAFQSTSCHMNGAEYANGVLIPKQDPCLLCRCFYGRELCQEQKCPAMPALNCIPEYLKGYCCPRFTCRIIEEPNPYINQKDSQPLKPLQANPSVLNYAQVKPDRLPVPEPVPGHPHKQQAPNRFPPVLMAQKPSPPLLSNPSLVPNKPNNVHFPPIDEGNINKNKIQAIKETHNIIGPQPLPAESKTSIIPSQPRPMHPSTKIPNASLNSISTKEYTSTSTTKKPNLSNPNKLENQVKISTNKTNSNLLKNITLNNITPQTHLNSKPGVQTKDPPLNVASAETPMNEATTQKIQPSTSMLPTLLPLASTTHKIGSLVDTLLNGDWHSKINSLFENEASSSAANTIVTTPQSVIIPTLLPTASDPETSGKNPWDVLRVSHCNIYGNFYKVEEVIVELTSACKKCFCSSFGVQCSKLC